MRHVAVQRAGGLDHRQREQGAAGLAQPQAQVEERLEPELLEHERVAGLGRPVAGDQRLADGRVAAGGGERGGAGRVAVEEHRHPAAGRLGGRAGEGGELEAADG